MKSTTNLLFGTYLPFDEEKLTPRHKKWINKQIVFDFPKTQHNTFVISPFWKMGRKISKRDVPDFNEVNIEDVIILQQGSIIDNKMSKSR